MVTWPARFLLCAGISGTLAAASQYEEKADDFSNGRIRTVAIDAAGGAAQRLFVTRRADGTISVQFATTKTIFPDGMTKDSRRMEVVVTHKVDTAEQAESSRWLMPPMKYENATYPGDGSKFLEAALAGNSLALRLERNAEVYKFDLAEARAKLQRLVDAPAEKKP